MIADLVLSLCVSLLLTLLFEGLAAMLWGVRGGKNFLLLLLVNTLTNPPVVLLCSLFPSFPLQIALEIAVVCIEGLLYKVCSEQRHPFLFSLCCNGCSYLAGIVIKLLL